MTVVSDRISYSYIRFLTQLLSSTTPTYQPLSSTTPVSGLDIGTGASLIYPLLATAIHPSWTIHGTEIDSASHHCATLNAALNPSLSSRIHIHHTSPSSPLIDLARLGLDTLDFTMCNPPFYESEADLVAAAQLKRLPPSAVCTGAGTEMITPGGDAGFALRMVAESTQLRGLVGWYTIMLGRLSSVGRVVDAVKAAGCVNWAVQVLTGGRKTRRWVVGWSWRDYRPDMDLVRSGEVGRELWGLVTVRTVAVEGDGESELMQRVTNVLKGKDVFWTWDGEGDYGVVEAKGNTWSRAARRKKTRQGGVADTNGHDQEVTLAMRITAHDTELELRWLKGTDEVQYESFCGMLKRALKPN